jgi:predicted dithiol-disulfide oxidoreductase (DUF899 family)
MTISTILHPPIVSREQWLIERKKLLEKEKTLFRERDRINAERRRLPMVRLEKNYLFDGPTGKESLAALFNDRRQLIIYHFMFDPNWEKGCPSCTSFVSSLGDLSMLAARDTTFALVSRAPISKLSAFREQHGWTIPWYSSFGSEFNYDFHVSIDETVAPGEYNYRTKAEIDTRSEGPLSTGEYHGLSVFFRLDHTVCHTYSAYARATETLRDPYGLLDATPYGRQQDFEDSPPGWPQRPTYGKVVARGS